MPVKSLLNLAQAAQALALTGENIALVKKRKKTVGDFIGLATKNIVGVSLIKTQADITASL